MDFEDQAQRHGLLAPSAEDLALVAVFPVIANLKKDVSVSILTLLQGSFDLKHCPGNNWYECDIEQLHGFSYFDFSTDSALTWE